MVVGGSHNTLVAAADLDLAGPWVCVLERSGRPRGDERSADAELICGPPTSTFQS